MTTHFELDDEGSAAILNVKGPYGTDKVEIKPHVRIDRSWDPTDKSIGDLAAVALPSSVSAASRLHTAEQIEAALATESFDGGTIAHMAFPNHEVKFLMRNRHLD